MANPSSGAVVNSKANLMGEAFLSGHVADKEGARLALTARLGADQVRWAMRLAARMGSMRIICALVRRGCVEWDEGLVGACEGNRVAIMRYMQHMGATDHRRAFFSACVEGSDDVVGLYAIETPLRVGLAEGFLGACMGGHQSTIDLFIDLGFSDWEWGLIGAVEGEHLDVAGNMIRLGAENLDEALLHACRLADPTLAVVRLLVDEGARNFNDALRAAAENEHRATREALVYFLIDHGAEVEPDILLDEDE